MPFFQTERVSYKMLQREYSKWMGRDYKERGLHFIGFTPGIRGTIFGWIFGVEIQS